uniref:Uncharacterized protein n=1 Tax=Rangifer tarandus platyrhynchus TaxID=3082113 RepID=A0ACB0ESJ3_RANTA|nr:unnamed protein product [Rangifer tarandus platyrhynchus]
MGCRGMSSGREDVGQELESRAAERQWGDVGYESQGDGRETGSSGCASGLRIESHWADFERHRRPGIRPSPSSESSRATLAPPTRRPRALTWSRLGKVACDSQKGHFISAPSVGKMATKGEKTVVIVVTTFNISELDSWWPQEQSRTGTSCYAGGRLGPGPEPPGRRAVLPKLLPGTLLTAFRGLPIFGPLNSTVQ